MSKRTPHENLKSFSIIYIILAVLYVGAVILCSAIPDVANMLKISYGNDVMMDLGVSAGVSSILYLWYFWMARRVADSKSNGIAFIILLIVGIVSDIAGSLVNAFVHHQKGLATFLSLDAIVGLCALYFVYQVKKEN